MRGHLTEKADVFSFGVAALEIISGRANSDNSLDMEKIYLLEWVKKIILNLILLSSFLISAFFWLKKLNFLNLYLNYCLYDVSRLGISMKIIKVWGL